MGDYNRMTNARTEQYLYCKYRHDQILQHEIYGHKIRTRGQPNYEIKEPGISFYAKIKKRSAQKSTINALKDNPGNVKHQIEDMLRITYDYFTNLYTLSPADIRKQQKLLDSIAITIS